MTKLARTPATDGYMNFFDENSGMAKTVNDGVNERQDRTV